MTDDFDYGAAGLSEEEMLGIARDRKRALVTDRYRISLTSEPGAAARLEQYDTDIEAVDGEIARLEKATSGKNK